jgi:hypothetical protein
MKKIISFCVVIALLLVVAVSSVRADMRCENPDGYGAMFYKFEKIIIYYESYTHLDEQNVTNYPEALKYDNFSQRVMNAVRTNFSACLKGLSSPNPIIVIPPGYKIVTYKDLVAYEPIRKELDDPKNLVLVVKLDYRMPVNSDDRINYGQLQFSLHRAGLTGQYALNPSFSGMMTIFPQQGGAELETQLAQFFGQMRLVDYRGASAPPGLRQEIRDFSKTTK